MAPQLMGKKIGMRLLFKEDGKVVAVTAIAVEPNVIVQVKNETKDGYNAIVLGSEKIITQDERTMKKRVRRPQLAMFQKKGIEPRRHLSETRVEDCEKYNEGEELSLNLYADVSEIDVIGTSKGKGFQGLMKKEGYAGGPASHGSGFHRHGGSTGMRSTPGRCLPGGKRPSQMGGKRTTVQNIKVYSCVPEDQLLIVEGSVPGAPGDLVYIQPAVKRQKNQLKYA